MRTIMRIRPNDAYVAEVVLVVTSLGAKRPEYNAGKRARDLLEIKRVHHKIIDFNRDCRGAMGQTGTHMDTVIERLSQEENIARKLQTQADAGGDDEDLVLPQVFIDGLYVGNAEELQCLEDDGLLEQILLRKLCPARIDGIDTKDEICGEARRQDQTECRKCNCSFEELMPNLQTIQDALHIIDKEEEQDDIESDYSEEDYESQSEDHVEG